MLLAALAAGLFLIADAPQSNGTETAPPAVANSNGPAMVKKRVCREIKSTGSRNARKECETVMVPATDAGARKDPDKPAGGGGSSATGGA